MRSLSLFLLGLVLVASVASAQTLQFYQTDFDFNGNLTPDSAWGTVEVTYTGSAGELYLNVSVNGSWQVQDVPLFSHEGAGVVQTETFAFDLGVPDGVDVTNLTYGYTISAFPTGLMPPPTTPATVMAEEVEVYPSGDPTDFPIGPATAAPNKGNGAAAAGGEAAAHKNFPNQHCGKYECAPTAVSNSLKFLKSKHSLAMNDADITIDKMKTACGFIANWGCPRDTWWQTKKAYMKTNKLPITTKKVATADIKSIIKEIKDGQDVEMEIWGHTVAVTGVKDMGGGKYKVSIAHDKKQGDDTKGLETGSSTFDSGTGKFTDGILKHYKGINYFVVECPLPKKTTTKTTDAGPSKVKPGASTGVPTIPADFFGPGSDPFDNPVPLKGKPILSAGHGDASTLLQMYGLPGLRDADAGFEMEFEVEMVELSLVSAEPILVSYAGGMIEEWDVEVVLNPVEPFPTGFMFTHRTHDNGGMFDGILQVWPRLVFTRIPDGLELIFDPIDYDPGVLPVELPFAGSWVYDVEPALNLVAPNDGYMVWGVEEMAPGDPASQVPAPILLAAPDGCLEIELWPAEPVGIGIPDRPDPTLQSRAYPNPFNPSVTIEYRMPTAGHLSIEIYTLRGERVRVLRDREVPEGIDRVTWDGTDAEGRPVSSGVYLYQLRGAGQTVGEKITLVK